MVGKLIIYMKKLLLTVITGFMLFSLNSQSLENKSWSIDYNDWVLGGLPALHVNCGTSDAFDFQGDFTIELWVRAWSYVENRKLVGKSYADDNVFDNGYIMGFTENQVYTEYFNPNSQLVPITGNGTLPLDSAYVHLASVYSVSQGKLFNYINGNLSGETDMFPSAAVAAELAPLIIGSASWQDFSAFQSYGDIDEVRLWNKGLSADDIKASMHTMLTGNEEDLTAYYNFNNAVGELVPDDGPNELDGTLSNSDHNSTSFAVSAAPVGDEAMIGLNDIQAAWYRTEENFHRISSDFGMSVLTDIRDNEFWKYLVMGNTGENGITSDNAPSTQVGGAFTFDIAEADASDIDANLPLNQYALLWRPSLDQDYIAIANPISPVEGIYQFINLEFMDGYYAFGSSSETFEIVTNISSQYAQPAVNCFPNPSNGLINLTGINSSSQIKIHNSAGILVKETVSNSDQMTLNLKHLPKGTYHLNLISKNTNYSQRIIIN